MKTACSGLLERLLLQSGRVFTWRERSRSGRRYWSWSIRAPIWPRTNGSNLPTALREWREAGGVAALVISKDDDFAKRAAHRALRVEAATGALKPIKRGWFS